LQTLRSIIFTFILFVTVVPFSLVMVFVRIFSMKASYYIGKSWAHTVIWSCKVLCRLDYSVEGKEHIPATNCVVFIKHSSAYETIVQLLLLPRQSWVLKHELIWTPFLGWALACLHPVAINRKAHRSAVKQVIHKGKARLAEGLWMMIFPEGTRMRPGETRRYGISGTLLAQQANTVILPIAHNAGDFWPRRGWRKKPGTIRFVIGPTLDPAGRNPREINEELQNWMENTVADLRG
jgi:1-acyl-sn-glycerol-3-phosphate acyltransferase